MAFKRLFADFADKNLSDLWAELNRRIELSFASAVDKLVRVQDSDTTSGYLLDKLQPGEGITLTAQNVGGDETIEVSAPGSTTDQLVKVQASDTTPSYLASKLVAGANVALTPQNVGGNETLRVDASGAGADELVKVSVADTTPGFLGSKIANGTNIAWTVLNPGANEQLRGNVTIPAQPDQLVRVQASDTTSGYLNSKLVAGTNVTLTPQNVGGNQTLRVDAAGGGGAGGTLDVVLGQFVQADQLVYLDAPRNSAWPEARAHQCHQGIDFYTSIIFEQGGAWDAAPSQPYCYDACAVSAEVAVAAYNYGNALRIRAAASPPFGTAVLGTPVDLIPDLDANNVAYVSISAVPFFDTTVKAVVISWVNPVTNTGWLVAARIDGTTVVAGTPVQFTNTGCLGTAVGALNSFSTTAATGVLAWADVASNSGLSNMFDITNINTVPVVTMRAQPGSPYAFTTMPAALIGQPTFRVGSSTSPCSIMWGVEERRVRKGYTNPGNAGDPNTADINWSRSRAEARVDGYDADSGVPQYVLTAAQYGTGDFFDVVGNGACLVTGTRVAFANYLYQVEVNSDPPEESVANFGTFSHRTRLIGGGPAAGPLVGAALSLITLRAVNRSACVVAAISDNAGDAPFLVMGWGYFVGGSLRIVLEQPVNASPVLALSPHLGSQPQHAAALFPMTKARFGRLSSYWTGTQGVLRLYTHTLGDPRVHFTGITRTQGVQGATVTVTLPGAEHTFTTSRGSNFIPGDDIFIKPQSAGFYWPGIPNRTSCCIGVATAFNKAVVQKP